MILTKTRFGFDTDIIFSKTG